MEKAESLNILSKMISIQTVNDNEQDLAVYIKQLFDEHHIFCEIIPYQGNRANLVAEIGDGDTTLAFSGHLDTVMAGDGWDHDPFTMTEEGDSLIGRGACDMKSGLAAMVIAMIELHDQQIPLKGKLRFMATVGEEVGEYGAQQLTDQGYMDDVSALVIGEPSVYNLVYTHMGSLDLSVTSFGKAAHSSMPQNGLNAIEPLLSFLERATMVFKNTHASDHELGKFLFNVTTLSGGTQVNAIPSQAKAEMNFRTIPEFDNQHVMKIVRKIIDDINQDDNVQLTTEVMMDLPVVKAGQDTRLINLVQNIEEHYFGDKVQKVGIAGTTDAAMFLKNKPSDFPLVITGPGNMTMHQVNESVPKELYFDFIDIYQKIAQDFLQ